jgi:hypothetical protein
MIVHTSDAPRGAEAARCGGSFPAPIPSVADKPILAAEWPHLQITPPYPSPEKPLVRPGTQFPSRTCWVIWIRTSEG